MSIIKIYICLFFILLMGNNTFSQNKFIDSLQLLIKKVKADTNKVNHLNKLSRQYIITGLNDTAKYYGEQAFQLAKKINYKKGIAIYYNNMGGIYNDQGNYPEALKQFYKALDIFKEIKSEQGVADVYYFIGSVYFYQQNYSKALNNYSVALSMYEKLKIQKGIAMAYNGLGAAYSDQGEKEKALQMYLEALKIEQGLDKEILLYVYNNIGNIYSDNGDYSEALKYYDNALKIAQELENKNGLVLIFRNIGVLNFELKKYNVARLNFKKAIAIGNETGNKRELRDSYKMLAVLDSIKGAWKDAYLHHKLFVKYKDSLDNEELNKQILQTAMTYEFEKKEAIKEVEHKKEVATLEKENQLAEYKKYFLIISLVFVTLLSVLLIHKQQLKTKRQKEIYQIRQKLIHTELDKNKLQKEKLESTLILNQEKLNRITALFKEKSQLMDKMQEQLTTIESEKLQADDIKKILINIEEYIDPNEYWEEFITSFNLVYKGFFDQLTKTFIDLNLTRNELRLCALIKCNLGNKEIANVLNISPDSVKKSRTRLRKKLQLEVDDNLTKFILNLN